MYPAVAAVRARGETAILEDIAVPVASLGQAIHDLQDLFKKHQYQNGIIFGTRERWEFAFRYHAKFERSEGCGPIRAVYRRHGGIGCASISRSTESEHGTGRNMAPFVETEWGPEAMSIMRELKQVIDPHGILNPDVIVSSNKQLHLNHLKKLPVVEQVVDKCIECGACEPRCPSRDLTLSPRQRIVLRRAAIRLRDEGNVATARAIEQQYEFQGKQTCATDGLCAVDCPVNINTGELIKLLRKNDTTVWGRAIASQLVRHFSKAERLVRLAIASGSTINQIISTKAMTYVTTVLGKVFPKFPQWHPSLSTERIEFTKGAAADAEFIYVPACMSRMMGGTIDALMRVSKRVGLRVALPREVVGSCCGQAFSSKGFTESAIAKQAEWIDRCWRISNEGRLPIIVDLGSCTAFMHTGLAGLDEDRKDKLHKMVILDSIAFAHDYVLPKLVVKNRLKTIAIHSVCSNQKSELGNLLGVIAKRCAEEVIAPHEGKCCGMGGDRGFEVPELVLSSTKDVKLAMEQAGCSHGFTSARSCAIALETGSEYPWRSVFHLLDQVSS